MPILRIEHEISDLATWLETFKRFAPAREQAGVQQAEVFQPADDPNYIVVNLRFESVEAATGTQLRFRPRANIGSAESLGEPSVMDWRNL